MIWQSIGTIAGLLVILSWVPQIIKGFKTKSLKDLSYLWLICLMTATVMWIAYGFHIMDVPILITNFGVMFLMSIVIVMKAYYDKKNANSKKC